jgi:DNA polymerase-1
MELFGITTIKFEELCGKGAKEIPFSHVPVDSATVYACQDADITFRLAEMMKPELENQGLVDLLEGMEQPLVRVLLEMENTGIRLDSDFLQEMSKDLETRLEAIRAQIYQIAGEEFNINSPKQLRVILFEKLNLPVFKRTKTGPSTDIDTMERLAGQHPLPQEILNYRHLSKLKSTYVDTLPGLVSPKTGRIHANFNQTVAATGRLSGSDPNLQNIPIRTDLGRQIRQAFLPQEGWKLLSADYSQIELRVLAHFTNDPALVAAFENEEDIHSTTASAVFGVPLDQVDSEMRRVAKAVNFGIIYGQGAFGLSQTLGIPQSEARTFINTYFERFASVPAFVKKVIEEGTERGYVTTMFNRRRYLPDLNSRNRNARNAAERTAVNSVIQGTAADVIKRAMIAISHRLHKEKRKACMLVQVHDELLFEVPPKELKAVTKLVCEEMEGAVELRVPLAVEASTGDNWGEIH